MCRSSKCTQLRTDLACRMVFSDGKRGPKGRLGDDPPGWCQAACVAPVPGGAASSAILRLRLVGLVVETAHILARSADLANGDDRPGAVKTVSPRHRTPLPSGQQRARAMPSWAEIHRCACPPATRRALRPSGRAAPDGCAFHLHRRDGRCAPLAAVSSLLIVSGGPSSTMTDPFFGRDVKAAIMARGGGGRRAPGPGHPAAPRRERSRPFAVGRGPRCRP